MEGSSVRLEYSRISTQCVNVLALGLVAGLDFPLSKLSKAQAAEKYSGSATNPISTAVIS